MTRSSSCHVWAHSTPPIAGPCHVFAQDLCQLVPLHHTVMPSSDPMPPRLQVVQRPANGATMSTPAVPCRNGAPTRPLVRLTFGAPERDLYLPSACLAPREIRISWTPGRPFFLSNHLASDCAPRRTSRTTPRAASAHAAGRPTAACHQARSTRATSWALLNSCRCPSLENLGKWLTHWSCRHVDHLILWVT